MSHLQQLTRSSCRSQLWPCLCPIRFTRSHCLRRTHCNSMSAAESQPHPAEPTKSQLWMAAIKPPMYSVGILPVMVSAAAAFCHSGALDWARFWALIVGSILVIAWLNLSNDAFDADTGVDKTKLESVVNLTGNRPAVLLLSKAFLAAGASILSWGISSAGDPRVTPLLAGSICCGYLYQGPPFRLSYKGLGEPLCFTAFGPLATIAFYLAQLPAAPAAASTSAAAAAVAAAGGGAAVPLLVWVAAVVVGITTSAILFCSHFHQIEGDVAAGKRSPLVRLGTDRGCKVLTVAVAAPYVLLVLAAAAGVVHPALLLASVLSLPQARDLLQFAYNNHTVPALIAPLKRWAIKWHVVMGLSLVLGMLVARQVSAA